MAQKQPFDYIDYQEQMDADVVLVSDYFLDLYKPETVWDVPGTEYFTECPVTIVR